jgi:hypothetical protein
MHSCLLASVPASQISVCSRSFFFTLFKLHFIGIYFIFLESASFRPLLFSCDGVVRMSGNYVSKLCILTPR